MKKFLGFLHSLTNSENKLVLEAICKGYLVLVEVESINKNYLLKLVNGDVEKVKQATGRAYTLWQNQRFGLK